MASVQRTPPKSQNINLTQTRSEPDISSAIDSDEYVTNRNNKRPRCEHSPQGQLNIQDLLDSGDRSQNARITKMLSDQSALISKLVTDITEIKTQNLKIQESNAEIRKTNIKIEQSMSFMNDTFEELRKEVEELKKVRQEQRGYIENLEKKILDLQYKSRSSGIEIRNIPQFENETTADIIKTVCSMGLSVGVPIPETELRDVYRLPGKPSTDMAPHTSRPIIVEFTTVRTKQTILSAIRTYNNSRKSKEDKLNTSLIGVPGTRQAVYVAEQLPHSSKKLFFLAREFAKKNSYKFCWISNGNIFLRKQTGDRQLLIKSEKCIEDLVSKNM
ncbi:hypothetical protein PYW08_015546 [Mythimna loreyi]|uniref:Uncharacterized protein n=1 Tax=Mythimna loreyi TaxID=667449 RepID=A0ACC2QVW8_9NEOP|nr:hypothetical protein PYW08_015546 [Mythimna loreyi]